MLKRLFNLIGWVLLLGMLASWIKFGFLDFYLIVLPATYVCFSINDGRIKKLKKIKEISTFQVVLIFFAFIASVGIVFGLIQLANYLINDLLQLTGWLKTLSQWTAVILSLYPVKFTFARVVYKVNHDLNAKNIG
ncbi:disulfide bond formation protein DsbD [Sporosarcina soli]|uniref:Disulfide bond formation protein DsbD n=1 Tax=Sporosarcina soli TaxID=334736 RepID=A0ABW0TPU6_9BACL